jgi:hypothetical protein
MEKRVGWANAPPTASLQSAGFFRGRICRLAVAHIDPVRVQKGFLRVERVDLNALEPLEVKRFHLSQTRS